jgi:hypothetical protein
MNYALFFMDGPPSGRYIKVAKPGLSRMSIRGHQMAKPKVLPDL